MKGKNGVRNLPGRTGDEAAGELFRGEGTAGRQGMFWRADTGDGGLIHFPERQGEFFLSVGGAQDGVHLLVFHHI